MDLYNLKKSKLEEVQRLSFYLEKNIQSLVKENVETHFNLKFIHSEFTIGEFRLDLLCYNNENNLFAVIEYKGRGSYFVIYQGSH